MIASINDKSHTFLVCFCLQDFRRLQIYFPKLTYSEHLFGSRSGGNFIGPDPCSNSLQIVEQKKLAKSRLFKAEPLPMCKMENDCMNDMAGC